MQTVHTIAELRAQVAVWKRAGERVAFVPTMGNLHRGHIHLVERARAWASRIVASIFVNPLQFGPNEDFAAYPRTLAEDSRQLAAVGLDLLFAPGVAEVYPRPLEAMTHVTVPELPAVLCGASRPTHFLGVTTVVTKLFNMAQPDVAVFGEKDWQQLVIIRRMAADLDMPVEIVGVPTVREADGLAMSSRNGYLSPEQRAVAPTLYATLQATWRNGGGLGNGMICVWKRRARRNWRRRVSARIIWKFVGRMICNVLLRKRRRRICGFSRRPGWVGRG